MIKISIAGGATHGKDFTAIILKELLEENGKRVLVLHFADYLKYLCKYLFGWNGEKDDKGRSILQYVGTNLARNNNPDIWVNVVKETIEAFKTEYDVALIPDCRFPSEIYNLGEDTISVQVKRLNYISPLTEEQLNHPSETALNDFKFDYVLEFETGRENVIKAIKESGLLGKI